MTEFRSLATTDIAAAGGATAEQLKATLIAMVGGEHAAFLSGLEIEADRLLAMLQNLSSGRSVTIIDTQSDDPTAICHLRAFKR